MKERDNIFKKLETKKVLPKEAKEELISNIELAKLASDLADLFGSKFLLSISSLFNTKR